MTDRTFNVEGMSCGRCKAAVEEELGKLSGIKGANADPQKGTVEVAYREDQVNDEQIKGAIEEAGYSVVA